MELRDYQNLLKSMVYKFYNQSKRSLLLVLPTGAGKTAVASSILRDCVSANKDVYFIVHRRELLNQTAAALDKFGLKYDFIASNYPETNMHKIKIASINTLLNRMHNYAKPRLVIFDECFVAGTLIGDKPIEDIKEGELVESFCENTMTIQKKKIVRVMKNKVKNKLVRVSVNNSVIICTQEHPFYTTRGWVKAESLKVNDYVYVSHLQKKYLKPNNVSKAKNKKNWKNILLYFMWEKIRWLNIKSNHARNEYKVRFRENEIKKSNEKSRDKKKNIRNIKKNWTQTNNPWGEWKRNDKTPNYFIRIFKRISTIPRVLCANWENGKGNTKKLQNRYSNIIEKNSDRSRWIFSLLTSKARAGQEKRRMVNISRLESVEIFEQGNFRKFAELCPDGYVYNIEVEDFHTYFANGVAVHNCHRIASKTWTEVFNYYNESLILGLTATPCRLDGQGLGKYFEEIVTGNINTQMLIDRGHLSPFKYYAPSDVDLSDINTSMGDFDQTQLAHVMNKPSIVGNVVEHYQKIIPGKKAIIFCVNVEHSIHVMNAFRSTGINAAQVDGNTPTQTRDSIINNFTNGQINILTNVNLFTEGFDVPHLDAAILCRPTHSLSLHLQMVGRALRTSPSKTLSYIIDHVGNYKRHGLPNDQRYWSLNAQKKTVRKGDQNTIPIKRCESCFHVNHAASIICSNCHTPFPVKTQELIPETEGELVEITEHQKKLARMEVGKAKSLAELQAIARERGYKPGWVFKMASLKNLR